MTTTATALTEAVEAFGSAFDRQDVDEIMARMTEDCVFESTAPPDGKRREGQVAVRAEWEKLFASTPGARFETEEMFVAGDRAVVRWRYSWADGHVRGVDVFRFRDGLVAEKLSYVKG
jgi:ketosteroid isomerase-like protein